MIQHVDCIYRVVAEDDPLDPRLFAYIISAQQISMLKTGELSRLNPFTSSLPINIGDVEVPEKDAPKLVLPAIFFEGNFSDQSALAQEWERLISDFLAVPIIGNVVLSKEDIMAKQHFSIHPEIDQRVKDAIAKLTSDLT